MNDRARVAHLRNLIYMARDMHREVSKEVDPSNGEALEMRIGVHVGSIIGGVIGTKTLRYDMWGQDVLLANELESSGVPTRTLISADVKNKIAGFDDLECSLYKTLPAFDTYLVNVLQSATERD